ncbi:MAG: GNAT family N-acetyltransferase [Phycisphaerae bacterium]
MSSPKKVLRYRTEAWYYIGAQSGMTHLGGDGGVFRYRTRVISGPGAAMAGRATFVGKRIVSGGKIVSLELRTAEEGDDSFLFELYCETRKSELDAWGWPAEQREAFLKQQFTAQTRSYVVQFGGAEHKIIERDGQAIGSILVHRTPEEFRLVDISLVADVQGNGIGTRLIRRLIKEARSASKPLRLSVLRDNPALRLYQRLGLVVTGDDGIYVRMEIPHKQAERVDTNRPGALDRVSR